VEHRYSRLGAARIFLEAERWGPLADPDPRFSYHSSAARSALLDHIVGEQLNGVRYPEAERIGGFHVDYQLELGGL
jgi:hypothetical protein